MVKKPFVACFTAVIEPLSHRFSRFLNCQIFRSFSSGTWVLAVLLVGDGQHGVTLLAGTGHPGEALDGQLEFSDAEVQITGVLDAGQCPGQCEK